MRHFLPIVAMSFVLTACGGAETPETEVPVAVTPAKPVAQLTPVQRGAKLYSRCRACHTLEEGGANKVGPNLWNIYGSKTASKEGFAYSKAMMAADIIWDETTMDGYLEKPSAYMPGNKMTFIGLKKQEDRDAIQAYLKEKTTP